MSDKCDLPEDLLPIYTPRALNTPTKNPNALRQLLEAQFSACEGSEREESAAEER